MRFPSGGFVGKPYFSQLAYHYRHYFVRSDYRADFPHFVYQIEPLMSSKRRRIQAQRADFLSLKLVLNSAAKKIFPSCLTTYVSWIRSVAVISTSLNASFLRMIFLCGGFVGNACPFTTHVSPQPSCHYFVWRSFSALPTPIWGLDAL